MQISIKNSVLRITLLITAFLMVSCEDSILEPNLNAKSNIQYFDLIPNLSFPKSLNQSTSFSLKHPNDTLIKNFKLEYRYFRDPDYNFLEYDIHINIRPNKLSVFPKKEGELGKFGALYPFEVLDSLERKWDWSHKGLVKRYDENLDINIDFNLDDHIDCCNKFYAMQIMEKDSIYYGWFRLDVTEDSIRFLDYAYSTVHKGLIMPGQVE